MKFTFPEDYITKELIYLFQFIYLFIHLFISVIIWRLGEVRVSVWCVLLKIPESYSSRRL